MKNPHYPDGDAPDGTTVTSVLAELNCVLVSSGLRALFMGGIGSAAMARPRKTDDIDVFVHVEDADALLDLEAVGVEVERTDPRWLYKAHRRGVLVDVIFRSAGDIYLDQQVLDHAERCEYHGVEIRAVSPEDLLVIKAVTASEHRSHHWYDALGIISLCDLDWAYLSERARRCGPRRVLSLLLYAESMDLTVPAETVHELFHAIHPSPSLPSHA